MAKPFRAVALTIALVFVIFSVLVYFAPGVSAASRTWTTDGDFNEPGASFLSTEVIGTGVPAKVELIKSTYDWANRNPPAPTPGNVESPSMAFADTGNVSYLFGGYVGGAQLYSDKLWKYDFTANTWTEITGSPRPGKRQSAGLTYDPVQRVLVLFGGYNDSAFLADTWEFNVQTDTWTETTPTTSPPPMADYGLVYYAMQSRHVLMGQSLVSGNMETWAYNAAADTWTNRAPGGMPSVRSGFAFAYHAGLQRAVLNGGTFFMTWYDATFEYNWVSNSWSQTTSGTPPARASHAMTYRPATQSILLFGGSTQSGVSQETWAYDMTRAWNLVSTGTQPPARRSAGFTMDTKNDVAVLYGGADGGGTRLGDTWTLGAAYANAGRWYSGPFDSGGFADWGELWWNLTSQPANTFLRFQIATSNDGVTWSGFHGPTGVPNPCTALAYFTTAGTGILCSGDAGKRYIKLLADFGTFDTQVTPSLEDVAVTYTIPPAVPCIVRTDPANITFDVPTWKNITIQFSEPMDITTVEFNPISGFVGPGNFTKSWSPDNTVLTLYHPTWLLGENQVYRIQVFGEDLDGNPLSATCPDGSPAAPNPFIFVTQRINPWIVSTDPAYDDRDVPVTASVVVTFSEGMNTTSVTPTFLQGTPVSFTQVWSAGDSVLTLTHATPFSQCMRYELQINGTDKANLPLVPKLVPNPWIFHIFCDNPYIVAQSPLSFGVDVGLSAPIIIDFSEPMLVSSVVVTIGTIPPGGPFGGRSDTWTLGNTRLTITHTQAYPTCRVYTVGVVGTDPAGNPLIDNPIDSTIKNPWMFMTLCDNPFIFATFPADGETDVADNQDLIIAFSEQMTEGSVTVQVTGGPFTEVNRQWSGSVMLTITHLGWRQCTRYTIFVQGNSLTGFPLVPGFVPNPWSFDVVCNAPYVTNTNPANQSVLVPLTYEVWANFSKAMDTSQTFAFANPSLTFAYFWSNGDTTLRLTHAAPFVDCTSYTMYIDGLSTDGYSMLLGPNTPGAPNPWTFTTRCAGFYIIRTDPAHNAQNVPWDKSIVVEFSEPVDRATFQFSLNPPGGISFSQQWSGGDTIVTLTHTTPFSECVQYTATVSARNLAGNGLINVSGSATNPWQFRTQCIPPQILTTSPIDQATNVPLTASIIVDFSEPMSRPSIVVTLTPNNAGTLTRTWSNGDRTLTVTHSLSFAESTLYTVLVTGTDLQGNPLVPGPVPNPWVFTTGTGGESPGGLQVIRSGTDIILQWRNVTGASSYVIYHAIDKFAPWPWSSLGEVGAPGFIHFGGNQTGLTDCYIVRAKFGPVLESGNSTMGCKVHLSLTFSAGRSNVHWLSLPYRTIYRRAIDISNELGSAKIDVVGKWDPGTQSSILWYFFRGEWRGTNFAINAGDGIYIGFRSSFAWTINGTDGAVPHTFNMNPLPLQNINWISLGITSRYRFASDVVFDIEGGLGVGRNTKIIEVAKWDRVTQSLSVYSYTPAGWGGTNFLIDPGDGIYLRVVNSFIWTPALITPEVP